jgi:NAD-dependent deacetylase
MKKVVVFSGAGISAESGIKTFRDSGGLWEEYNIKDVATPEAWEKDQKLVLGFYNQRRKQVMAAKPNDAHKALVELEKKFDVQIITQNVDDLHERAGSKKVLHLHGEIMKARSTSDPELVYTLKKPELELGDMCKKGSQLRPHIVWFGEMVPNMELAHLMVEKADILIVTGTSLNVHPAAGLVDFAPPFSEKYVVDPNDINLLLHQDFTIIKKTACEGITELCRKLMHEA